MQKVLLNFIASIRYHEESSKQKKLLSCLCDVDTVLLESTDSCEALTSQKFKVSLYYPILGAFLMELNHRFSGKNVEFMKAIHACNPQYS